MIALLSGFLLFTDTTKVHVDMDGADSNYISYTKPNENFFDNFQLKDERIQIKGAKSFDIVLNIQQPTFWSLGYNNERRSTFVINPNDSVSIHIRRRLRNNYHEYILAYSGTNANAHNLYKNSFSPIGKYLDYFLELSKAAVSYDEYYLKSKQYIDSLVAPWDSLKTNNLASKEVCSLYSLDIRAALYNEAIKKMWRVKTDSSWGNYAKFINLKHVMYFQADAPNKLLMKTCLGQSLHNSYLRNILVEDAAITDSLVKKSDIGYYYYYDTAYREKLWAESFRGIKNVDSDSSNPHLADVQLFKKYYPQSKYFKRIVQYNDSLYGEAQLIHTNSIINTQQYAHLKDIFADLKGRYFFIDVWATTDKFWINEFNTYSKTRQYFERNSITKVFLSIDNISDTANWQHYILEQKLGGIHCLLNNNNQSELLKILSTNPGISAVFIPQYLLYDKEKNKFYTGLPKPSTGAFLQSELEKILQLK